jgi:hypothetical protein
MIKAKLDVELLPAVASKNGRERTFVSVALRTLQLVHRVVRHRRPFGRVCGCGGPQDPAPVMLQDEKAEEQAKGNGWDQLRSIAAMPSARLRWKVFHP